MSDADHDVLDDDSVVQYRHVGHIGYISLNRPKKANALSIELMEALDQRLNQLYRAEDVRVIVISGNGRGFSGGYDVSKGSSHDTKAVDTSSPGEGYSRVVRDYEWLRSKALRWLELWNSPKPVIAKVHGYCYAGGLELALSCDLVVAASDATFGFPAVRAQGVPPMMLYPWFMNLRHAKAFLWTGDDLSGVQAEELGLINEACPPDELDSTTERLARRIALMPPDLLLLSKRALHEAVERAGFRSSVLSGVHFDALAHETKSSKEFRDIANAEGLKKALSWRDKPYG